MGNEGPPSHPYRAPAEVIVALRRIEISEGWRRGLVVVRQLREGIDRGDYDSMNREELSAIISDLVDERDRIRARVAPAAENGLALASAVFSVGGLIGLKVLPGSLLLACICIVLAASAMAARSFAQRWIEVVLEIEAASASLRGKLSANDVRALSDEQLNQQLVTALMELGLDAPRRSGDPKALSPQIEALYSSLVRRQREAGAGVRVHVDPGPSIEGAAGSDAEDVDEGRDASDRKQRR